MVRLSRISSDSLRLFCFAFCVAALFSPAVSLAGPPRGVAGDLWADKILGQFDFSQIHDNEVDAKNLNSPTSSYVDILHNILYLWDAGNNRLLAVQNLNKASTGQGADLVLGQPDFVHAGCNRDSGWQTFDWRTSPNGFYSPPILPSAACLCSQFYMSQSPGENSSQANMASDAQGNLYVPDYYNNRVLRYNYPITTEEPASYVWGQLDSTGTPRFDFQAYNNNGANAAGGPTSLNLGFFNNPYSDEPASAAAAGVAIDAWGNLWVTDTMNNRVLRFPNTSYPAAGVPSTTADVVLGQANFTSDVPNNNVSSLTTINTPKAVRVDVSGNVYVCEQTTYGRISFFTPTGYTGAGMPIYALTSPSYEYSASSSSQPDGIEIDPTLNTSTQVGFWVIDHDPYNNSLAYHYEVTWPTFSITTLQTLHVPEAFYAGGVGPTGDLYLASYRGMSLEHYPAGSSSPDSLQVFEAPTGSAGTANRIGDSGLYGVSNVVLASAPGSGVTQLIGPGGIGIHFWNLPANGPAGFTNGQVEDGYAGTSQPYVFTSTGGYADQLAVDSSNQYIWCLDAFQYPWGPMRVDAFSLPLPPPTSPEVNPAYRLPSFLPVLGGFAPVSWTRLTGVASDGAGNLWITDEISSRVMRVRDPMGKAGVGPIVDVILGQPNSTGSNCNGNGQWNGNGTVPPGACTLIGGGGSAATGESSNTFFTPSWLQFDHHGDLFVSDHYLENVGNYRLLRFDAKSLPVGNAACSFAIPADGVYGTGGSFTVPGSSPYNNAYWECAFNSDDSVMVAGTDSQWSGGYPPVIIQNPRNGIMPAGTPDIPGLGDNLAGHLNDYAPQSYGVAFDAQDNLYTINGNRGAILVYYKPFTTYTPTPTPTITQTPAPTVTGTLSPSLTPTVSSTFTPTPTPTPACGGCLSPQVTYGSGTPGSGNGQLNGNCQLALGTTNGTECVYIADINNSRVDQFYAASGAFMASFNGVDAVRNPNGLSSPYGVALSGDGRYLFAASTNGGEVVKMDLNNNGAVSAVIATSQPLYLTVDTAGNGDLYVGNGTVITRYHEQTPNQYVTVGYLGTAGSQGSGSSQFFGCLGVWVQNAGSTVYVADSRNDRIMEWTSSNGGASYSYAATVYAGNLSPEQLAPDPSNPNRVYMATTYNGYAILDMSTSPIWSVVYLCDPEGQSYVTGIGVDTASVYFSLNYLAKGDSFPKPYTYCLTPIPVSTVTATPTATGPTATPTPSPTSLAVLSCGSSGQWAVSEPSGLALDPSGNIYLVDDSTNLIDVYYPNGTLDTHIGAGRLTAPSAVAVDGNGVVYVTDETSSVYTSGSAQYQVDVFNSLAGTNPGAFSTSWGTAASGTGLSVAPVGIAVNSAGTSVYVADQNLNQIEVYNGIGTLLNHWGSSGGDGNGTFGYPVGAALDASGNVYVADWYTNLVQVFSPQGTWLRQWDVTAGTGLLAAQFISVYQNCLVYVTDGFGEVGVFDTNGNALGTVVQGGGGEFIDTEGVAVASAGNWYVADLGGEFVSDFNPCPVTQCPAVDPTPTPTQAPSPSATPTPTATATPTLTPTLTSTPSPTLTPTNTPTPSATLTASATASQTPTESLTLTGTPTTTPTPTPTNTSTPTVTASNTPTATPTVTSTQTPTFTLTPSFTWIPTITLTPTIPWTATSTPASANVVIGLPYPNPVWDSGPVSFNVQGPPGTVFTCDVFTTAFRKIAGSTQMVSGYDTLHWDLKDMDGAPVADGLYYLRVKAVAGGSTTVKILKVLVFR